MSKRGRETANPCSGGKKARRTEPGQPERLHLESEWADGQKTTDEFEVRPNSGGGECLFLSLAQCQLEEGLEESQGQKVRDRVVSFAIQNWTKFKDTLFAQHREDIPAFRNSRASDEMRKDGYRRYMSRRTAFGTSEELQMASLIFDFSFTIVQLDHVASLGRSRQVAKTKPPDSYTVINYEHPDSQNAPRPWYYFRFSGDPRFGHWESMAPLSMQSACTTGELPNGKFCGVGVDTASRVTYLNKVIALTCTHASAAKPSNRFPDFLAPFRTMFGRPSGGQGAPHHPVPVEPVRIYHSNKDSAPAETSKPFGGDQEEYDDGGFKPFFPNGLGDSGSAGGPEEAQYAPQPQQQQQGRPYPRPQFRPRPQSSRPPRQEASGSQEFTPRPFEGPDEDGRAVGPGGRPRQGGFSDFSFSTPDFSQGYDQPQHAPQGPRPRFPPPSQSHGGSRPFQGPRPSHGFSGPPQGRPFNPSTPADGFSPEEFPETLEHRPRGTRGEPQIITLEDIQRGSGGGEGGSRPFFDDGYRPGPHPGLHGPVNAHTRHVPAFQPAPGRRNPIFQSQPLRPSAGTLRPFTSSPSFPTSSEESPLLGQESKAQNQLAFQPSRQIRGPNQAPPSMSSTTPTASTEEVHYGRPMMMSASSTPTLVKKVRAPKHKHGHSHHAQPAPSALRGPQGHPILLSSPKIPNYKPFRSPSAHPSVPLTYEPHQAASGDGLSGLRGGGDPGAASNGDRILYHVAGHQGPYSYRFGYDTGKGYNRMFRHEEKDGTGYVKGKYGFYDNHGKMKVVNYEAHPEHGFHADPAQ